MAPRVRAVLLLVLAVALAGLSAAGRDYYEVLGVERDASSAEIKRAFRKLSLKVRAMQLLDHSSMQWRHHRDQWLSLCGFLAPSR